jgi:hypothetical protein
MRNRQTFDIYASSTALGQTENDFEPALGVNGLAIPPCRRKADLLGGLYRRLVQAVTQALHYTNNANLACCGKLDLQFHVSFDLPLACF